MGIYDNPKVLAAREARRVARQAYFDARDAYFKAGPDDPLANLTQAEALGPALKAYEEACEAYDRSFDNL